MNPALTERIQKFNSGRNPVHLALKYRALRESAFRFFRGTCHLFFENFAGDITPDSVPSVWSCGDLHLENFGSYRGDSRLVYFDINDYDEAALAPATWDVTRFLSSVCLACDEMKLERDVTKQLCASYLDAYAETLEEGHARLVEIGTARGIVREFLESLQTRKRRDFLNRRTEVKKRERRLIIDGIKIDAIDGGTKDKLAEMLAGFGKASQNPEFFELLDAGLRIAGTGSLGLERYVLLVKGKGSPDRNYLLDMKFEPGSAIQQYSPFTCPHWPSESHRVVAVQRRMQGIPQALLAAVEFEGRSFVLRELQPTQDRIDLDGVGTRTGRLIRLLMTMGQITAWDQLRSSGRQGSSIADELSSYGSSLRQSVSSGDSPLIAMARSCADATVAQYQEYCRAYDAGWSREQS